MKLIAQYNGKKKLNVRESPNGEVIRTMKPGETAEVISIRDGWCEFVDGAFANIAFVDVETKEDEAEEREPEETAEEIEEEDYGELTKMTVKELRKLAKDSGIEIPAGAHKDDIIHAILADE